MGAPYRFGPKRRTAYLEHLAQGMSRAEAAEAVGVSRRTAQRAATAEPDFAAAIDDAEMAATGLVESALVLAAVSGNVVASRFWLCNRRPDRWRDERAIHSGADVATAAGMVSGLVSELRVEHRSELR